MTIRQCDREVGQALPLSAYQLIITCLQLLILPCFHLAEATLLLTLTYVRTQRRAWIAQEKYKCNVAARMQDSCRLDGPSSLVTLTTHWLADMLVPLASPVW
ncbi:hypothetical protein LZ32DRAFT_185640 [Colletotrichum eremochloae]|nr:hypothetical protein LZ32DRAFT_185640 [Colletotrichum eremochloae]